LRVLFPSCDARVVLEIERPYPKVLLISLGYLWPLDPR